MNLLRLSNQQMKYAVLSAVFVLSAVVALIAPMYASADALTNRSIALSDATPEATGVTYKVTFNAPQAAGAYVVDFCSDSPVIGDTCAAPAGFTAASADTETADTTVAGSASQVIVTQTVAGGGAEAEVEIDGITNPDAAGPLYARIVSYDNATNAAEYSSATMPGTGALDWGGVALSITNDINVTGRVLESMIFCVASDVITEDCANASANPPVLKLGEGTGSDKALVSSAVSTGDLYTQISTNAAGGAVVSLKSDALGCGGLVRLGAPASCDIAPALNTDISAGEAKFGVKTSTAAATMDGENPLATASGTYRAIVEDPVYYNASTYAFRYVTGDGTGVTSVYGDPFLDTANAPVNNMNMKLTFGASVSNDTPAGDYSTHLSLIATGKF